MANKNNGKTNISDPNSKKDTVRIIIALAAAVLSIAGAILVAFLFSIFTDNGLSFIEYLSRCIIAAAAFIALGGIAWLRFDKEAFKNTWKFVFPLVLINAVLGILLASTVFLSNESDAGFSAEGIRQLPYTSLLMLLIGINEELIFRGLLLGGLLLWFGKKKNGVLLAAVISSIVFGVIHVMFGIDLTNLSEVSTGLMKTLETSMFGLVWCYCVLKYKDLIGAITSHAFFDWLIVVGSLLSGSEMSTDYVTDDPKQAVIKCVFFGIIALLYLPRTIKAFKGIKAMEPTSGPFAK